jgi:hypothetical protein
MLQVVEKDCLRHSHGHTDVAKYQASCLLELSVEYMLDATTDL